MTAIVLRWLTAWLAIVALSVVGDVPRARVAANGEAQRERVDPQALRVLTRYVEAVGGDAAVRAVTSRVTRGTFTNARGLSAPFVTYFKAPHRLATVIGRERLDDAMGSGRAYDGAIGWDKNFIGTGLRELHGAELNALARTAVAFPIAALPDTCGRLTRAVTVGSSDDDILRCEWPDRTERRVFDHQTGLAARLESSWLDGSRTTTTHYEDYRQADRLMVPFRTYAITSGNTTTYAVDSVRHQVPVDDAVFKKPRQ